MASADESCRRGARRLGGGGTSHLAADPPGHTATHGATRTCQDVGSQDTDATRPAGHADPDSGHPDLGPGPGHPDLGHPGLCHVCGAYGVCHSGHPERARGHRRSERLDRITPPGARATGSPSGAPATDSPRARVRIGPALRRWRLALVAVLPCLTLAGVGWWFWPSQPAPTPLHLVAGTVHAALLTPDEASRLTGMTLTSGPRAGEPAPAMAADPSSCRVAVGPATQAVFGKDWTAFLSATYQDAGGLGDYTMTQVVGVYSDSEKAGAVLRTLTGGIGSCPSAVRTDQDRRSSKWTYRADDTTVNSVAWTAVQDGGNGWACYRQAQVKGKSLVQVGICAAGDARSTVQTLIGRIVAEVSE